MPSPSIAIQLDTATFPSSSTVDIKPYLIDATVELGVDQDCDTCAIHMNGLPSDAVDLNRIYISADGDLIFNGAYAVDDAIVENRDGTYTLRGQGAMAKLRRPWAGPNRTYSFTDAGDTERSVVQNLVEASAIDATLTFINGTDWPIATVIELVLHGGNIDLFGTPTQADVPLDLIRKIDQATVPNFVTYARGDGAIYRTIRAIGSSVATFASGSGGNAWDFEVTRKGIASIRNKCIVNGATLVSGFQTQASKSASNSLLAAPWEYNVETITNDLVEDQTHADDLAQWVVDEKNGLLRVASWTTAINTQSNILGSTVRVTDARRHLSSRLVYVTRLIHSITRDSATTSYQGEFRV